MNQNLFAELPLVPELLRAIGEMGFSEPTPIQAQSIPLILEGRDVVGRSQTGTGKTAAFGIPAIQMVDQILIAAWRRSFCCAQPENWRYRPARN